MGSPKMKSGLVVNVYGLFILQLINGKFFLAEMEDPNYLSFLPNLPLTPADILTGSFIVKIKKEIAPKLKKMPENLRKQVIEEFLSKEEFLKHIDVVVGIFLNSSPGIKRCMLTNVLSKNTKKA